MPSIEIVDEDPQTPTIKTVNVADAYDWQYRAYHAEQELSIERTKLEREKRRSRRFQIQIDEYIEALTRSTQDCCRMANQYQLLSNTNFAIAQELQKAKLMVETLEAVILMLYKLSPDRDKSREVSQSNGKATV
jgi:hypothetical protein